MRPPRRRRGRASRSPPRRRRRPRPARRARPRSVLPVAATQTRAARSRSFALATRIDVIRSPSVRPRRTITAVENAFRTSFCAVPALSRVEPEIASGPAGTSIARSARRASSEPSAQTIAPQHAPAARAASRPPSAYGVRPLAETATTTSCARGCSARDRRRARVRVVLRGRLGGRAGRVLGARDERDDPVRGHRERRPHSIASTNASQPADAGADVDHAAARIHARGGGVGQRGDRRLGGLDGGERVAVGAHDGATISSVGRRSRSPSAAARPSVSSPPSRSVIAPAARTPWPGGRPARRGCRARCSRRPGAAPSSRRARARALARPAPA